MEFEQEQKQQALSRMKAMKIMKEVIDDFKKNGRVYYSERQNSFFQATLYWLDNNPEWEIMVKEYEKESGCLVYHAQLTHTEIGDMLSLFFVSGYKEDWPQENEDIANGRVCAHVINLSDGYSETGYIGFKPIFGGVVRTW